MQRADPGRVTYRNPAILPILAGALTGFIGIAWISESPQLGLLLLLLLAALAFMLLRLRVDADDDGITVVNYFSTRRIPWSKISYVQSGAWHRQAPLCVIGLHDHTTVRAWALNGGQGGVGADYIEKTCTELDHRRARPHSRTP